jgi:phenylacetate-CoA ligase
MNFEEKSGITLALRKAYKNSKYWKKILEKSSYNKSNFKFTNIPFLTKKDLLLDQKKNPPFGNILSVKKSEIVRVHKTSGTSADPLLIFLTKKDIEDTIQAGSKTFIKSGLSKDDRVIHCLNFNMWSGGITDYTSLERTGATCVPFGTGNTENLIELIKKLRVNAISCTPSYIFKIAEKCKEIGTSFKSLGLKKGFFGGENLLQISNMREIIEKKFNIIAIDANYGVSEVLSIIAGEDNNRNGLIYNCQGILFAELINKNGKNIQIKKNAVGELVLTTIKKEAQPLFRYRTNDTIQIIDSFNDKIDNLKRFRFKIIGRSDEMFNIKGINFFPESLTKIFQIIKYPALSTRYKIKKFNISKDFNFKPTVLIEDIFNDQNKKNKIEELLIKKTKNLLSIGLQVKWLTKEKYNSVIKNNNKHKFTI